MRFSGRPGKGCKGREKGQSFRRDERNSGRTREIGRWNWRAAGGKLTPGPGQKERLFFLYLRDTIDHLYNEFFGAQTLRLSLLACKLPCLRLITIVTNSDPRLGNQCAESALLMQYFQPLEVMRFVAHRDLFLLVMFKYPKERTLS